MPIPRMLLLMRWHYFLILLLTFFYCAPLRASGFYIQEQSVSALGEAFAGAAADTQDASTIYYNPAGMTYLGRAQITAGAHIISPRAEFTDTGTTVSSTVGTGGGTVMPGDPYGGDPFDAVALPNFYAAFPVHEDVWLGFGISAPFGLVNEYDDNYFARYDSTENELITVNAAPSAAWAPLDWLSLGVGVDIQYAEAKLENALPSPVTAGGPTPATDGYQDLSGDDMTIGFNAGIILKPTETTRIGVHYRQGISHTLKGRLITRLPADLPGVGGTVSRIGGQAELNLPAIATLAVSQKIDNKLTLLGHASWIEWSNFDDIPILLDNGTATQDIQNYKNTWSVAVGARYQVSERLVLKTGAQYDQSPTQDGFRTTRIPDGDRTWIAAGAGYDLGDNWSLDISAAYLEVKKEPINLTDTVTIGAASTTYDIQAVTSGSAGVVSTALQYRF